MFVWAKPHETMSMAARLGEHLRAHPQTKRETAAKLPGERFIGDAIDQIFTDVADDFRAEVADLPNTVLQRQQHFWDQFCTSLSSKPPRTRRMLCFS